MNQPLDFIIGLMKQNTNELGFIPSTTIEERYLHSGQYLIQERNGTSVGYLLHGVPITGKVLTIAQACIEYDYRDIGHGHDLVQRLINRGKQANSSAIKLHCADHLAAQYFWEAMSFVKTGQLVRDNSRKRDIGIYVLQLWPTLFDNIGLAEWKRKVAEEAHERD
jgi:N-acetylglutamate synthase-like GNAT family acetyltransferase